MISQFKEVYENRHLLAKKWKQDGKKIFGYVYSFTPEEILYAADILAIHLTESEEGASASKGEVYIPDFYCDFIQSCFGQGIDGVYNYLDGVIFTDSCTALRTLAEVWQVKINTPFFFFLSYPSEANELSKTFLLAEFTRLKMAVEDFCNREISLDSLRSAIEVYNENRELLKRLYELRQREESPISGSDIIEVVKAGLVIPKEKHNQMLKELLRQIPNQRREVKGKARLMVSLPIFEECAAARHSFIRKIEELGAEVVGDDLCLGPRYFWEPVTPISEPMEALVDRYLGKVPIAFRVPAELRAEILLSQAEKHRAKGAIFFLPKYCQSQWLQYPYIEERFKERGIATLLLETTADMPKAPVWNRLQAFIEMLRQS